MPVNAETTLEFIVRFMHRASNGIFRICAER